MHIFSVNVGQTQPITYGVSVKTTDATGIYKQPSGTPVHVGRAGLAGDTVVDTQNHGGPDQAVYVYGLDDYLWWSQELGQDLPPGTFGENLTIAGLASAAVTIGDRLQAGPVTLEVSAPRIPCRTLATRMGDPAFVKRFRAAERPGLYCRVIQEGEVSAGDPVTLQRYQGETLSIGEMFRSWYDKDLDETSIRRQLAAPIAERARTYQEARLQKLFARRAPGGPAGA